MSDTVVADICSVFQRFPNIEEVLIFGSRAKGSYSEGSDIDLAAIGYKVDVVDYNKNMDTPIGEHINRVGKIFYKKES